MHRPFVYINMASTADGKITSASREYPGFTSRKDRDNMDRLRAEADALLVGAGTMRADNPALHVRNEAMREYRQSLGKPGLLRVLVTASAKIDLDSRFFDDVDGGERIVATVDSAPARRIDALAGRAEIWRVGADRVDLPRLLERLHEHGVEKLLAEGGGELNWALFESDLVDELNLTIAPALLGGREAPTLLEGTGWKMAEQRRLRLSDLRRDGDELYCRYSIERAESS